MIKNGYRAPEGYSFDKWLLGTGPDAKEYKVGDKVKNLTATDGDHVLFYAKWKPNSIKFTLVSNPPTGKSKTKSLTLTVTDPLPGDTFTCDGYRIASWNTKQDGSGQNYLVGEPVSNVSTTSGASVKLYAQWGPTYPWARGKMSIYTQWDQKSYGDSSTVDGGTLGSSGCGWFSLAHVVQWFGLEPIEKEGTDAAGNKLITLPLRLYEGLYEESENKGAVATWQSMSPAINYIINKYQEKLSYDGAHFDNCYSHLIESLSAGKVCVVHNYGHYYLAVEISEPQQEGQQFVHIVDSCLNVPYIYGVSLYRFNEETNAFVPASLEDCAVRTDVKTYVAGFNPVSWGESQAPKLFHSGGEYWITTAEAAKLDQIYVFSKK